jgi:hypothetical protein
VFLPDGSKPFRVLEKANAQHTDDCSTSSPYKKDLGRTCVEQFFKTEDVLDL